MKTTVVLNNFPKTYILIPTFFISIKSDFYTILFVAMVTKFKNLRLDYCGFGPFCSTGTKLLLSISLLMVLICIIYQ